MATRKSSKTAPAAALNESDEIGLFQAAPHQCPPIGTIILDLGNRLGALDRLSRNVMTELLQQLVESPDEAPEIARLAGVIARVQKPMARDAALNRALTLPDAHEYDTSRRKA